MKIMEKIGGNDDDMEYGSNKMRMGDYGKT